MSGPLIDPARVRRYWQSYHWLAPLCLVGVVINLAAGVNDLLYPSGWWSYLFGALSFGCAGVCAWAWRSHRRLNKELP